MNDISSIYSEIETSSEVMNASNHRLIQLLLDKCLQHMKLAKIQIQNNEKINRNNSIAKASDIVEHLCGCLNRKNDETKAFSEQLNVSYQLVQKHLLNAMLKNDTEHMDVAIMVITNIKSGWDQIG